MRRLIFTTLLLFSCGNQTNDMMFNNVVAIIEKDTELSGVVCGGTFVKRDMIITAAHCIPDNRDHTWFAMFNDFDNETHRFNRRTRKANIVAMDRKKDLAALLVDDCERDCVDTPIVISRADFELGDDIKMLKHDTQSFPWTFHAGIISSIRDESDEFYVMPLKAPIKVIQTNMRAYPCNSGGGIFSSKNELIGVGSWYSTLIEDASLVGIHRDEILDFLFQ